MGEALYDIIANTPRAVYAFLQFGTPMVWVTRNDTVQYPNAVLLEPITRDDLGFRKRVVLVQVEATSKRNRFRLQACRVPSRDTTPVAVLPAIGYLCTDNRGDVVIMPAAGNGAEYLWALGTKQIGSLQGLREWGELTLWNAHADEAHRDWRDPTAVVALRAGEPGAPSVLTTTVQEVAEAALTTWTLTDS